MESPTSETFESGTSDPIYKTCSAYHLDVKVNDLVVVFMKIDSGCNDSIINQLVWEKLGKPEVSPTTKRYSATGALVDLKGQITAKVEYAGRVYELPLQVSNQPDTRNLIGRRWFPSLCLNWNRIFYLNTTTDAPIFQEPTELQKQQEIMALGGHRTFHFYLKMKLDGKDVRMMFDTGCTQSKIGLDEWKLLGEPSLKETRICVVDTANKVMALAGEFVVRAELEGQIRLLPLLVTKGKTGFAIIGSDWFKYFKFNLNSIFAKMKFSKEVEKPIVTQENQGNDK